MHIFYQSNLVSDSILRAQDLEGYISSTFPPPGGDDPDVIHSNFVAWRKQNQNFLCWLQKSSMIQNIIARVVGHSPSYTTWTALECIRVHFTKLRFTPQN